MKATNNSTNTLFMEIFVELLEIAKAYFQELFKNEKPGVYTLKDVYAYIANCESLETKQGNQVQKSESNCLCSFDITFSKKDKTFLTAKTKNSNRYIDNNILIDINLGKIYATDAFTCKSRNVKISNLSGNWDKHICISFDVFKKVVGKDCKVMVNCYNKEGQIIVTIKTTNGEIFECRYNDFNKNINIEEVSPILYKELKLTVKDSKQFAKDLKTISKVSEFVSFEVEKGSDRLRVNYITEFGASNEENKYGEFYVQLSEPSNFTYRTDNKIDRIISCLNGWNGEIYITKDNDYCKLSFVSDNCDNCFMIDGGKMNYFDQIRNKVDYFPNQLTPVSCEEETKESDTNIKPIGTLENQNDTNLQESKESALNTIGISKNEWEKRELFLKDTYNIAYEDGMISFVTKDNGNLVSKIYIWTYTKRLGIYSKVGASIEKDIDTSIPFVEFLEQFLVDLKRHATNKVFFFMEKEGYSWQQPNAQTFHLFKNGKEKTFKNEFEAYNFVQNKENKRYFDFNVSDYADGMLELVGLDLENLIFKVNQNSPKELKVIQDIKLYDKTGKIVFTYNDGSVDTVIETTFNGYSVLQSVLQSINENV